MLREINYLCTKTSKRSRYIKRSCKTRHFVLQSVLRMLLQNLREINYLCTKTSKRSRYIKSVGNPNGVPEVSVGNPNGVPEVSHVVSNVAETDAVSKERFSRSSTVSFALDLPIGGVSTVHNHRSSTVQFPVESCTLGLNSQAPWS